MVTQLQSILPTFLKRQPKPASELCSSDKVAVPVNGTILVEQSFSAPGKHTQAILTRPVQDNKTWFIFNEHWIPVNPTIQLDVPYLRFDNEQDDPTGAVECGAMVANFFGANIGLEDYLAASIAQPGARASYTSQTAALKTYGVKSEFDWYIGFDDLVHDMAYRKPVIIYLYDDGDYALGWFVVVIGVKNGNEWVVHDPRRRSCGAIYTTDELENLWIRHGDGSGRRF